MIKQQINPGKRSALIISLIFQLSLLFGCAADKAIDEAAAEIRHITDIVMDEHYEAVNVIVKADKYLLYSSVTQVSPRGVLFQFPNTALDDIKPVYTPPDNEVVDFIETNEKVEAQITKSIIFIALKNDSVYDVEPVGEGLQISFPRPVAISKDTEPLAEPAEKMLEPEMVAISVPAATQLQTVKVTARENNVVVDVKADGAIKNYKSFTLDNPPRIVFDLYNLKSPYKAQQDIVVESKWVYRIRHLGYPDKVRLVLDTYEDFLSDYSASPTGSGLLIHAVILPATHPNSLNEVKG
jgi:type IV pilus assembly protein PilQ